MDMPVLEFRKGTPTALFLPAKNYTFSATGKLFQVALPNKGTFPADTGHPFAGEEFNVSPRPGTVLFGDLLKVLFHMNAYPNMADNQRFVLYTVESQADKVIVTGEVVDFLEG